MFSEHDLKVTQEAGLAYNEHKENPNPVGGSEGVNAGGEISEDNGDGEEEVEEVG